MPKLIQSGDMEQHKIPAAKGSFSFSAVKANALSASSQWTLATIGVDTTGSTAGFADQLLDMVKMAIEAIKKSPTRDSILVRVFEFNSNVGGVREIHGFKPVMEIDPASYQPFSPDGMTPLYDATFSALGATNTYAQTLKGLEYICNAIFFIITDGGDNASKATMGMIKTEQERVRKAEELESLHSVLIGIGTEPSTLQILDNFRVEAGFSQYIKAGDASAKVLAKIGGFISQSVSSTSQAIGTGGPSQQLPVTI